MITDGDGYGPSGVPATATYVPPGDDFTALARLHSERSDKRSYLRVSVSFVVFRFTGVMLRDVHHRALSVNRRTWSMGRCLVWSGEGPVPGVWVWSLADERASAGRTS